MSRPWTTAFLTTTEALEMPGKSQGDACPKRSHQLRLLLQNVIHVSEKTVFYPQDEVQHSGKPVSTQRRPEGTGGACVRSVMKISSCARELISSTRIWNRNIQ